MAVEAEIGAEDVLAEKSDLARLLDGVAKTPYGDRILGADVEVTVLSADSVSGDDHTLNNCEGVALEDGAVHKCAGVALVAVADDVLLVALDVESELPLAAGGESAAAAAAKTGGEDLVDDFLAGHAESALKALEGAHSERFVYILGVDNAAAVKSNAALLFIEVDIVLLGDLGGRAGLDVKQTLDDLAADDILLDDLLDVLDMYEAVKGILGIYLYEGAL